MVGNGDDGDRIAYTYTTRSCGTGDYYLVTERGEVWKHHTVLAGEPATGETWGYMRDGRVHR